MANVLKRVVSGVRGDEMVTQEEYSEYVRSEVWAEKSKGFIRVMGGCENS